MASPGFSFSPFLPEPALPDLAGATVLSAAAPGEELPGLALLRLLLSWLLLLIGTMAPGVPGAAAADFLPFLSLFSPLAFRYNSKGR